MTTNKCNSIDENDLTAKRLINKSSRVTFDLYSVNDRRILNSLMTTFRLNLEHFNVKYFVELIRYICILTVKNQVCICI